MPSLGLTWRKAARAALPGRFNVRNALKTVHNKPRPCAGDAEPEPSSGIASTAQGREDSRF